MSVQHLISEITQWYERDARPFLAGYSSERVPVLDDSRVRLEKLSKVAEDEVPVCLLGKAGVGKSTLINALVSPHFNVLPHGGIGTLTAQATEVRYASVPYLRVEYFPPQKLGALLLTLESAYSRTLQRQSLSQGSVDLATLSIGELALSEEDVEAATPLSSEDAQASAVSDKVASYQKQLRLMIQGHQEGAIDVPYLLDALRAVLSLQPRWGRSVASEDLERVLGLRRALLRASAASQGHHYERKREEDDRKSFVQDIRDHASGFLAPIIKSLVLGWNTPILEGGLVLVDLPGVGIANDDYRRVTRAWIRERARAILLVVDRAGVDESSAALLRDTGFLTRLLHDDDAAATDPVTLAVVMVKVDSSATSAWEDDRQQNGSGASKWSQHFAEMCKQSDGMLKGQVRTELSKLIESGPEETKEARSQVVERLLETLEIHPVSAPEYCVFVRKDEDERPRIRTAEDSGIPALAEALQRLVGEQRVRAGQRANLALLEFRDRVRSALELIRAQWSQDARAEIEARQLAQDLDQFLVKLRQELQARRGAFREFLSNGVPDQIRARVSEASAIAKGDISKYLKTHQDMHWATLRATIQRGGAFVNARGRHIDLPNELTLRFEEPVAVVWTKHILAVLRKRTAELGNAYAQMVQAVVGWARSEEKRVETKVIEALHQSLLSDSKALAHVGKDAIDELKARVRAEMFGQLEQMVRDRCTAFVRKGRHEGPGTKQRILAFLHDELAADIATFAQPAAERVLLANFEEVRQEILANLERMKDPLDRARDALILPHQDTARRSDAERRIRILMDVDAVLGAMPTVRS